MSIIIIIIIISVLRPDRTSVEVVGVYRVVHRCGFFHFSALLADTENRHESTTLYNNNII